MKIKRPQTFSRSYTLAIFLNASAFRDIWAQVMFFKVSHLHEPQAAELKNITSDHVSRGRRTSDHTIFYLCNSFKAAHVFYLSHTFDNRGDEENKPEIISSFTNKHKFYSIQKFLIALCNVFMLSSSANQNEIFC